jgi:hypothetical protein
MKELLTAIVLVLVTLYWAGNTINTPPSIQIQYLAKP